MGTPNQVYSTSGGGIEVLDAQNRRLVFTLPLGGRHPLSVAVHPQTGQIYIADRRDGSVRAAPPVDLSATVTCR